jgi:hypothetical protein
MPIYRFKCVERCPQGTPVVRKLLPRTEVEAWMEANRCPCGGRLERTQGILGVQKVERLDNGMMAKAVERPLDIHEQIAERKREG